MTVAELIEHLKGLRPDLTVALISVTDGEFFKIQEIESCEEFETGDGDKFCGLDVDGILRHGIDDERLSEN